MMRSGRFGYGSEPVSRRGVLIGALAVLAGAGGGVAAGLVRPLHPHHRGKPAPTDLVDALAAERALIARLQVRAGRNPALNATFAALIADHAAHATALTAALREYAPAKATRPAPVTRAPSKQQQRSAEATAAARAAKRAARLRGSDAALLASIAACEASHAEALR
jgi:hypothetical protein